MFPLKTILSSVESWLQNWDNATRVIAITGFLISLYNLLYGIVTQHKNFKIRVYGIKSYQDVTYLHIGIENKSSLSIAITQMFLLCGDCKTVCTASPTLLHETVRRSGQEVIDRKQTFSTPMPITISGLSAQSAFVLFEHTQELPEDSATHLTVQVCSTRGRPVQMKLELPVGWASQRKAP